MSDCIFCKIATGDVPTDHVYADDDVVAFRDLDPQAPTHVLVIPRRHIASAQEISGSDGDLLAAMVAAGNKVAQAEGIYESGYRLVFNVGDDAGNSVPHIHLHVLGGRELRWPPG